MAKATYYDNIDDVNRELSRAGIALQEAGSDAMNRAAYFVMAKYRMELAEKSNYLRNRQFTINAVRVYPAHALRSDKKTLRKLEDINAKIVIPQMSDGREHYLAILEVGGTKKGNPKMQGKVPIPLDPARGGDRSKAVQKAYRVVKGQTLKGTIDLSKWAGNERQQYAIIQSMNRRGKLYTINKQHQTSRHGYWLVNYGNGKNYMFSVGKKEAIMVRDMSYSVVRTRGRGYMGASLSELSHARMAKYYIDAANERLAALGK